MAMTMTQKILARAAGLERVEPGQLIDAELDGMLANDITGPVAIREMEKAGFDRVCAPEKIMLVMDHFVPNKDILSAEQCLQCRRFAREQGIAHFYDVGQMGIEHALLPEKGLVTAGDVIIGADSHTCTYGALGAFATGVGSTDLAAGMVTGRAWFRVPEAIQVRLTGQLPPYVSGKDVVLSLIGRIGVDGARYQSLEFTGPGVAALTMADRFTICNMAVEAGAKNGIFPVDACTQAYLQARGARPGRTFAADAGCAYTRTVEIDLSALRPMVAFPHLPENVHPVEEAAGIPIDQVVIGSCTNGRIEDMRAAAALMRGKHVAPGVRAIVIPATQEIYLQCVREGLAEVFIEAGAVISTPTCGPCLGGYMGILAEGERALATTNRNFVGRMGHVKSEVYLASPAVAAASAIAGVITDPAREEEKA